MSTMNNNDIFLERLRFFDGQRLFASDMQEIESLDRNFRWLHNQSLHRFGIGSGYAASGEKGDRLVTIGPGYAIDAAGREIVLTRTHEEPVPPVACDGKGNPVLYDLVVSYPEDDELKETETREGICLPRGAVRLQEEPVFCWVRLDANGQPESGDLKLDIQNGMKILIARAEVFHCQLNKSISTSQRRNARISVHPYVASGHTEIGATDWRAMEFSANMEPFPGFYVDVDTSVGDFGTAPIYCAEIVGDHVVTDPDWDGVFMIGGFTDISFEAGMQHSRTFRLNVFMPVVNSLFNPMRFFTSPPEMAIRTLRELWHIVWIGIEG